jgi:choline-sulfatase
MTPESVGFDYLTDDQRDGLADKCTEFLSHKQDRPFLLVASFINPHDICYMAIDAWTKAENRPLMYPNSTIERQRLKEAMALPAGISRKEFFATHCPPLPANYGPTADEPSALGEYGSFRGYVRRHWSQEDWRLHRWAYCRLTERVDAEIGRVLTALRRSGLDRNTLVIQSADHGDMDSAHGFEHKSLPYEEAARIPFIVSWPGRVAASAVDRRHLVSASVDLLPTLCDFAGIEVPAGLPGRSVREIVSGTQPTGWRDDLLIEFAGGRAIRSARYKYSVWNTGRPREMLIDMQQDPGEMKNLAGEPSLGPVLTEHRERLRRKIAAFGGPAV